MTDADSRRTMHGAQLAPLYSPLPVSAYRDAEVHAAEFREIFAREWLCVGREDELGDPGSYFTWQRTGIPTVLVRSIDSEVRGFYNSCRHRGAPVVRTPTGRARAFRCQYHSWTYDTFGKLMAIPDERDFGNIDRCAYSLVPLRVAEMAGFLFIDQSGEAASLEEAFSANLEWLRALPSFAFTSRATTQVRSNWKAVAERLAQDDMVANAGDARWIGVNTMVIAGEEKMLMLAAWPVDERTTEIELVTCGETDQVTHDNMLAALARATDSIPASGLDPAQPTEFAQYLAQRWRTAIHGRG